MAVMRVSGLALPMGTKVWPRRFPSCLSMRCRN